MEWWQGVWGWALTTVLAGVGAVGVVAEIVHRRREQPWVQFEISAVGAMGPDLEVFALTNRGTGRAAGLRCVPIASELQFPEGTKYRIPTVIEASAEHLIVARSEDFDAAWMLLTWTSPRGRVVIEWLPFRDLGPLGDTWVSQRAAHSRTRRRPWQPAREVGPDGVFEVVFRRKSRNADERIRAAFGALRRAEETKKSRS